MILIVAITGISVLLALVILCRTSFLLILKAAGRRLPEDAPFYRHFLLSYAALAAFALFDPVYQLPSPLRQATILSWILYFLCVMIRDVGFHYSDWRMRQMERMFRIFSFLSRCRRNAWHIAKILSRVLAGTVLIAVIAILCGFRDLMLLSCMVSLAVFLSVAALRNLDSCRLLLFVWFAGGIIFFTALTLALRWAFGITLDDYPVLQYVSFTLVYTLFWCFSIGTAEDDAGKMAAQIVNTSTTVLTIVINVIALYAIERDSMISEWPWAQAQAYSLFLLLPVVSSGYAAALFKDAQIYWRKKYQSRMDATQEA